MNTNTNLANLDILALGALHHACAVHADDMMRRADASPSLVAYDVAIAALDDAERLFAAMKARCNIA